MARTKQRPSYSLTEAHAATDLSEAMIRYLVREDLIRPITESPPGRGVRLRFAFADLVILRAIARLLEEGITVSRLRRDLKSMRREVEGLNTETARLKYLATDGKRAYLVTGQDIIEEVRTGQFAFRFMLNVGVLRHDVVSFRKTRPEAKRHRTNGLPLGPIVYRSATES
jgi:DNA-binding transcriptional MerR regulator